MKPLTSEEQQLLTNYYMKENKRLRSLIREVELEIQVKHQQMIDHTDFCSLSPKEDAEYIRMTTFINEV